MLHTIQKLLKNEHIELSAALPLSALRITKRYLLDRCGISAGSAVCFAIPYYTKPSASPNLSAYAYAEDYHLYVRELGERLCKKLCELYPHNRFAVFADHSPIDERHAAALGGLGIIGRHGMLITESYASYVFLAELITDAELPDQAVEIKYCEGCDACRAACPYGLEGGCLSALTQKKGELTADEQAALRRHGSVWGCDICSEACPYTKRARRAGTLESPIPFFRQELMPHLTLSDLEEMDDDTFSRRAYSWRGRETIIRNVRLMGEGNEIGNTDDTATAPQDTPSDPRK